jgi:hypothetical protein
MLPDPGAALRIIEAVKNENASLDELGKILSLIEPVFMAEPAKG